MLGTLHARLQLIPVITPTKYSGSDASFTHFYNPGATLPAHSGFLLQ